MFHRLLQLIDRVWLVTRPVISLKATAPEDSKDRPDHEIARAYEVAGAGEREDDEEETDVAMLLSGSWRATTGAGYVNGVMYTIQADYQRASLSHHDRSTQQLRS